MPDCKKVKLDHDYCLPPAPELRRRLDHHVDLVHNLQNRNKNQSRKLNRLRKKVEKLKEVIEDLESSKLISEKASELLAGFGETTVAGEMFER